MTQRYRIAYVVAFVAAVQSGLCWTPSAAEGKPLERLQSGRDARHFGGIYPHLAGFNSQGECGTGAVVPWAGKLWWVTYSPHMPQGSDDKLYAIDESLDLFVFPGSVGGTPANRFIHRESQQLLIGPYLINNEGAIRVIPQSVMPGRLTGNARHLEDAAHKVYYATMEEGFYEVDVNSLQVRELFPDANRFENHAGPLLPGYHGKGVYSGQGQLIYANNGELSSLAMTRPDIESGVLAEWPGQGDWQIVRRNQFTEVSGPGGLYGNSNPENDPVWSIGWDHRSLILMMRAHAAWQLFRLPKASHCYDGAHGWNTEWPRIREIGEDDLLMTMHGMFWRFPAQFRPGHTGGIRPRSTYLKVIGDFCRWRNHIVFGCDDAAQSEFLNSRKAKGKVAGPAQSQSNLWFVEPSRVDQCGPAIGRGAVWLEQAVKKAESSDPFLFGGFARRSVHLVSHTDTPVTFRFEIDRQGDGRWMMLEEIPVAASGYRWHAFAEGQEGEWIRVTASEDCCATVWFEYRNDDSRPATVSDGVQRVLAAFDAMAPVKRELLTGGLLRAGDRNAGLQILAMQVENGTSRETGYYELKPDLSLVPVASPADQQWMAREVAIPADVLRVEGHSILYQDDDGQRYRLPIGNPVYREHPELLNLQRTSREAVTERDLFQCAGTFFELPARNAGGFSKIRPVATHPLFVQDYCSWRGLLALTGTLTSGETNSRVVRSSDGLCAVWLGAVDDLWQLGKPVGRGGPWSSSRVRTGEPSDPYLCTGYDRKSLVLSHDAAATVSFRLEVDISGTGMWQAFTTIEAAASESARFDFPRALEAYWVRLVADHDCTATADFVYE
ncbi:MAG: hypothetical protein ACYC6N_26985 [Pirellulaceae bacterium]